MIIEKQSNISISEIKDWFLSRRYYDLAYQEDVINKILTALSTHDYIVLAACTAAGKSLMIVCILDFLLRENSLLKVIILAHATDVLRKQLYRHFKEANEKGKLCFEFNLVDNFKKKNIDDENYYKPDCAVNIGLPQTFNKQILKKADLLICDEAHQYFLSKSDNAIMAKHILNQLKPKNQILMTGSPALFLAENQKVGHEKYLIIPVAMNTVYDVGVEDPKKKMLANFYSHLIASSYDNEYDDFNDDGELKSSINIKKLDTENTMKNLVFEIHKYLKKIKATEFVNIIPDWKILLTALERTMIACKNPKQADDIAKFLTKLGVKCIVSHYINDLDSKNIDIFIKDKEILVLLVVYRGILGFNLPELVNVLDMTLSYNVIRISQLYPRCIRVDKNNPEKKKFFIKVAPEKKMLVDYYRHIMNAVFMLCDEYYFTRFNGKNLDDLEVPVKPPRKYKKRNDTDHPKRKPIRRKKTYRPIDMGEMGVFEFFKPIWHKKDGLFTPVCMTTMKDIRATLMKIMPQGYWTKEKCMESALSYNSLKDWQNNDYPALHASIRNNWYVECTAHMERLKTFWTKEMCLESAKKYQKRSDWHNNEPTAHDAAYKYNWINECIEHMIPEFRWTKEDCIENARKYNTLAEWRKNETVAYATAHKNGWFNECTEHMTRLVRKPWSKEECIEDAQKYNTRVEWQKNSSGAVTVARDKGWMKECCAHMTRLTREPWTKEECIKNALNYTKINDSQKNNDSPYNAARFNGWLKECCAHMTRLTRKPYTKEECIEAALKYNTRVEWRKNESGATAAAKNNGWYEECTVHMKRLLAEKGFWTKEKCIENAKNYYRPSDWKKNDNKIYAIAKNNGWYEECTAHMIKQKIWTKENCINSAKKYDSLSEWQNNESGAWKSARINGWYEECTVHMKRPISWNLKWTEEKCLESSLKYDKFSDWVKYDSTAYVAATKHNWLENVTLHMIKRKNWTKEMCINSAKECETITEWINNDKGAYDAAYRNKWINDCTVHMVKKNHWTKEKCLESANKYMKPSEWKKNEPMAYMAAKNHDWYHDCTAHMIKRNRK